MLETILATISLVLKAGGAFLILWGGVRFFIALPNHNGPEAGSGALAALGGAGIMYLSGFVTQIV